MSSGWAFYNTVRAWVAQHSPPMPVKADEQIQAMYEAFERIEADPDPPDDQR